MRKRTIEATGWYDVMHQVEYYLDINRLEIYADDGRCRELPIAFWYPLNYEKEKKCPLVVFSHGSFGVKESNLTLYRELASHGYVVCAMDHTYQCFSTKLSNGKKVRISSEFMKEIASDKPDKNPEQSATRFKKWMDIRMKDISFVLDRICETAEKNSGKMLVYGLIDSSRICVMGHSLGGSAALGIGRKKENVTAVISLEAPLLCDIQGISVEGEYIFDESEYPIPVLNIYSDASWEHLKDWKQYKGNVRLLDNEKSYVENKYITGIGHLGLTDFSLRFPILTRILDGRISKRKPQEVLKEVNEICLGFLDKYLKDS